MKLRMVRHLEYVGACRYTGYRDKSVMLKLECGHELRRKASQKIPRRAICKLCDTIEAEQSRRLERLLGPTP